MQKVQVVPRSEWRRLKAESADGRRLAEEVVRLRSELKAAHATIARLDGEVVGLVTFGDNLQIQMAAMNARLGTNSGISSKPLSSDETSVSERPGGRCSGRRQSGQQVDKLIARLQTSKSAHGDETSWLERLKRSWLWVGATTQVAVFLIRASRSGVVAREMFGESFAGVLCTDRWSAYTCIARRTLCWAHLLRDFTAMEERHQSPWHGHRLGLLAREILGHWTRWNAGEIDRETLTALTTPLRARFEQMLGWTAKKAPGPKAQGIARDLLGRLDELWRFLDDPLVHPTNNLAERLLRYAVIYRKLSFGTDSAAGSRYMERLLSAAATLNLQDWNLFEYLTEGMTAYFAGKPAPSLLPLVAEG